jgi:WD40 repeat protein
MALSPDGKKLIAGSIYGAIQSWAVVTGEELLTIDEGHANRPEKPELPNDGMAIRALAFSPAGQRFASSGADNTVKVWEVATGREVYRLKHQGTVQGLVFRPDGKRLLTMEGVLREWDPFSGELIRELPTYSNPKMARSTELYAVIYRSDHPCVLQVRPPSPSGDFARVLWDAVEERDIFTLPVPVQGADKVDVRSDGKYLVSSDSQGIILVYEVETGRERLRLKVNFSKSKEYQLHLAKVAFSGDGKRILDCRGDLTVWDVSDLP